VQSVLLVESRFTVNLNDLDVFNIVRIDPPDEVMLQSCAAEGLG
jgi:hypothetical protein